MRIRQVWVFALALASLWLIYSPLRAAELRMGLNSETLSIDPHFANFDSNGALAQHIFSPLIGWSRSAKIVK